MKKSYDQLRAEYLRSRFSEADTAADPFEQFRRWFGDALAENLPLANACALATASASGRPSVRMVLVKDTTAAGFTFFTNYESHKGRDLADNPRASMLFWWTPLERQVRITGVCRRLPSSDSDAYFATRPRASNLSAMVSQQSEVVKSREVLEGERSELDREWQGRELERPDYWGGFILEPEELEFWQGRADRLHDRLRYRRNQQDSGWVVERLYP